MATTASRSYTDIKRGLVRAIKQNREHCIASEAARQLLSYDHPEHQLVGINVDAKKAVYYHDKTCEAYVCPFSDSGPDGDRGVPFALIQPPITLECWIEKMEYFWGWVHPRFKTG